MVFVFLTIGLAAGVLSGLFGIGGGILIIPSLIFFAKFHVKLAIGTSLGAMLLPVGLLLIISVINPDYMKPMYQGWGWVWLGVAGGITVASIAIILRMVKSIEV